ncbi:MAG: universal stress protein [bacterium]|nr:universal stress protein [bacterium]
MKILLSTNFDESSKNAFQYTKELLKVSPFSDASLFLVHAHHNKTDFTIEDATAKLDKEFADVKNIHENSDKYIHKGSIRHVINSFVDINNIDLVIMGSREKDPGAEGAMLSNAMEVASHANCSVLIIPENLEITGGPSVIAFGSDFNKMDVPREALQVLKNLLKAYDATLKVFHVYPEGDLDVLKSELEANVSKNFIEKSKHEYHPVVNHETIEGIRLFLEQEKPDILTVIPRKHKSMDELYNPSVTKNMSHDVKLPLLVLR